MAVTKQREAKVERLEVRLAPATKSLLSHAAQLRHTTLTDFLVSSAVRAAEDVLVSPRLFQIGSDEGWRTLTELLDEPAGNKPDSQLVSLLKKQK